MNINKMKLKDFVFTINPCPVAIKEINRLAYNIIVYHKTDKSKLLSFYVSLIKTLDKDYTTLLKKEIKRFLIVLGWIK